MPARNTTTRPRTRRPRAPRLNASLAKRNPRLAATLAETRVRSDNPLRRVRTSCCGWRRDADAALHEWVWCDKHADWTRIVEVAE